MIPANVPLKAWRNADFDEEYSFTDDDGAIVDLVGYSGRAQVRLYGAQPGAPRINIPSVNAPIEGVLVVTPGTGAAAVQIRISQPTVQNAYALLAGDIEPGDPVILVWDLVMTLPDGSEQVWLEGQFIMPPGVTIA